tara:strand:- start:602 stop:925 length:324 start_codon:yes stop_codon:yes gene_type:complete
MHVQRQGLQLFKKKNADYGDAFAKYGAVGIIVRMGDKIMRAANIEKKGITIVDDESLKDTLIDLHNYSAMALMLMDEDKIKHDIIREEVDINKDVFRYAGHVGTRKK